MLESVRSLYDYTMHDTKMEQLSEEIINLTILLLMIKQPKMRRQTFRKKQKAFISANYYRLTKIKVKNINEWHCHYRSSRHKCRLNINFTRILTFKLVSS